MWLKKFKKHYIKLPVIRELREIMDTLHRLERGRGIKLHDLELVQHPRYSDPLRLLRYQRQICSQNGEDGMIHEIFRRIGTTNKIFAEVGVGDGTENNTSFLLSQGWTGAWVDGESKLLHNLQNRTDINASCLRYKVAFVSRENIRGILEELGTPKEFDLLSLDIDQNTYYLWEGLEHLKPRVVIVEYNPALPPEVDWKVNYDPSRIWDGTQNYGASLKALELLGRKFGYSLVGCDFIGTNAFFVRDDLVGDKFAAPFTAENHHEPPRFSLVTRRSHPNGILDRPQS